MLELYSWQLRMVVLLVGWLFSCGLGFTRRQVITMFRGLWSTDASTAGASNRTWPTELCYNAIKSSSLSLTATECGCKLAALMFATIMAGLTKQANVSHIMELTSCDNNAPVAHHAVCWRTNRWLHC